MGKYQKGLGSKMILSAPIIRVIKELSAQNIFFYSRRGYKLKIDVFKDVVHFLSKRVFVPTVFV